MQDPHAAPRRILRLLAAAAAAWLVAAPGTADAAKPSPKKPAPAARPAAGTISTKYRFKKPRAVRKSTKYIVLHTTEGSSKGSIAKLSARGYGKPAITCEDDADEYLAALKASIMKVISDGDIVAS